MKMHMGFWSPNHESQGVIDIRVEWARKWMVAMDLIEKTGRGTKRVIQAGGNVGIFPVGLSQHFDEVVTFEPVPEIYECLLKNIEPYENIKPFNHGLGESKYSAKVDWEQKGNSGGTKIKNSESGSLSVVRLDDFEYDQVDMLWLDIEGFEHKALLGAKELIRKHSPVIILENKGFIPEYPSGVDGSDEFREWVENTFGYKHILRSMRDDFFERAEDYETIKEFYISRIH